MDSSFETPEFPIMKNCNSSYKVTLTVALKPMSKTQTTTESKEGLSGVLLYCFQLSRDGKNDKN